MATTLLAVWLDSAEPTLIEEMMAKGELPTLTRLRARGVYGRLHSLPYSISETSYAMLLTGQLPDRTGGWTFGEFDPDTYEIHVADGADFRGCRPFYALGPGRRVATFDVPRVRNHPDVHGLQLSAWGSHSPYVPRESSPPEFLGEFLARHGEHPLAHDTDRAWIDDPAALADLYGRLMRGLDLRERALLDLLGRERWDLFFTSFSDLHTAGHYFWPHSRGGSVLAPLGGSDALRAVYRRVDDAIGRAWAALPEGATLAVFSVEGVRDSGADLACYVFLPELLFRHSFPWARGLELEPVPRPPSPEKQAGIIDWVMEVWHLRRRPDRLADFLHRRLPRRWSLGLSRWLRRSPPLDHPLTRRVWNWQPTIWYQPYWAFMKAFALLCNLDGFIRLNVRGRERHGQVAPRDYDRTCAEITEMLRGLRDPESGRPVVAEVRRTRKTPFDRGEGVPHPADLIVSWDGGIGNEVVSPRWGRLGPVPYVRLGEHTPLGFFSAAGPGIAPGSTFPTGRPIDVAPTLVRLLGLDPSAFPGDVLVAPQSLAPAG
jgi:predicted AlkP superfamily phosphohydrolase/phosphomutase